MPSDVAVIPNLLRGEGLALELGMDFHMFVAGSNWNISCEKAPTATKRGWRVEKRVIYQSFENTPNDF